MLDFDYSWEKKFSGSDPKVIPQPGAGGVREAWNVKCLNHCKIIIQQQT